MGSVVIALFANSMPGTFITLRTMSFATRSPASFAASNFDAV
jgi:hypothetical protein